MPENTQTDSVTYYWLATILTDSGRQITISATVPAVPGVHTRMSTVNTVMQHLKELYGNFTVLFLDLAPNEISAPHPATPTA
ncbi:hypothetical protein ACIRD2_03170 [Streptomyces sp. NPDC093595]|uniref:hypothetical protein n=1 Tax=Streptomyces sp. NPDC093595 TaxID=3366045 RepID=UPI0038176576